MNDERDGTNVFIFLFMLPLLLVSSAFLALAYVAAKIGAPRWVVSLLTFIPAMVVGNALAVGVCLAISFIWMLIIGQHWPFDWYMAHAFDLAGWWAWGPIVSHFWSFGITDFAPKLPTLNIVLFQAIIYFTVGRRVQGFITRAIT